MKKIVIIQSYELFPDFRVYRELALLRKFNADVHIIVWQRSSDGNLIGSFPDTTVHKVVVPAVHGMGAMDHFNKQPAFFKKVFRILKDISPDLIIAHNFDSMLPAAAYRMITRVAVLYVSREPYHKVFRIKTRSILGEWIGWFLDCLLGHIASRVITVTPLMMKMYKNMGVKAVWIPNSPTKDFFENPINKNARNYITVGFVGNLRPDCGIEEMYKAIIHINSSSHKKYHLFLCGLPLAGFENTLAKMQHENPGYVTVSPPVSPENVAHLYEDIDIAFQLPRPNPKYRNYGLNVKIYEALATGTPVIIGNWSENPQFLKGNNACIVVNNVTPEAIAIALKQFEIDKTALKAMGNQGREFIVKNFNWDIFSPKYIDIVNQGLLKPPFSITKAIFGGN